ncbi:MAG TPA: DUF3048 domain-containing protein [Streptosporangiaceae bacterium]|nr:DUF3048 domain-containing protein [Streptosporangiaceae bacterium]
MNWTRKKIVLSAAGAIAGVAAAVGIGLAIGSTPAPVFKAAPPPTPTPTPTPTRKAPAQLRSPFTGEPVKSLQRVLAVKIDNIVYARPQTGITDADIVYVLPVEGGLTRFLAIFSSHIPPVIGPVRSARSDDLELLRQFGRPAFAWSGAQPRLTGVIEHDRRIVDLYAGLVGGYYRNYNRIAPYNLYANTRTLLAEAKGASKAHGIGFRFGSPNPGGRRTSSVSVSYPAASYRFTWSAKQGRWLVWIDGARAATTEHRQMSAATVVIQHTLVRTSNYKEYGRRPPFASTFGHGTATVLRNGKAYQVRWSRRRMAGGTTFTTMSGQPMNFAPGPVWIVLTGNRRAESG